MRKIDLFNDNSVCIFTDASLCKKDNITYICSGVCVYMNDLLVNQVYEILVDCTIQQGELYAILLGVREAVKYTNIFKSIRLFSDSLTSILALRERLFRWINQKDCEGNLRGYNNNVISNQDYIISIVNLILEYNIRIELYHVKGHIRYYDNDDLAKAKSVFMKSNNINQFVDNELIRMISIANDQVDRFTGCILEYNLRTNYQMYFDMQKLQNVVEFGCNDFDVQRYQNLIN